MPHKIKHKTSNLLTAESQVRRLAAHICTAWPQQTVLDVGTGDQRPGDTEIRSHWHPNLTISVVMDDVPDAVLSLPPPLANDIQLSVAQMIYLIRND